MTEYFTDFFPLIHRLEEQGLVTRTFRRLDPQRQLEVLNAILDEAAEAGPSELNIKRVAERCNAAVGSLYQYFGNRQNLLEFTVQLVVTTTVDSFNAYRPILAAMPLREALAAYLGGGIEWSQQQVGIARFFARAAYQGDANLTRRVVEPIAIVMLDMMRDILQAAFTRGELRSEIDLEAAARLLNTLIIAVGDSQLLPYLNSYYRLTDETVAYERIWNTIIGLLENGLEAEKKQ